MTEHSRDRSGGRRGDVVFRKNPDVTWRRLGEEAVLLNVKSGGYYSLNEVGVLVWEAVDGEASIRDITRMVSDQFEVDEEQALRDVSELLDDLAREGLVGEVAGAR